MDPHEVLVVEDDQFYSSIFDRKLKAEGYNVIVVSDGEKALKTMREKKPDLVLLDMVMPVKDGFETLKEMREDVNLKDIKVIVLSNLGQESDAEIIKKFNITDRIVKANMSLEQMVEAVRKALI